MVCFFFLAVLAAFASSTSIHLNSIFHLELFAPAITNSAVQRWYEKNPTFLQCTPTIVAINPTIDTAVVVSSSLHSTASSLTSFEEYRVVAAASSTATTISRQADGLDGHKYSNQKTDRSRAQVL